MSNREVLYNFYLRSTHLSDSRVRIAFGICRSCLCFVFVMDICELEFC